MATSLASAALPTARSYLARGTLFVLAGMLFQQAMAYVNTALALRFVDVAVYGTVVFAISLANLCVPLAKQGLDVAATRFVAQHAAQGDAAAAAGLFGRAKWLVLLGALALVLLAPALHPLLPARITAGMGLGLFWSCFACLVLATALASTNHSGLLGLKRPLARSLSGFFVEPGVRFALVLALLPLLPTAAGLVGAWALPVCAAWLASEWLASRQGLRWGRPRWAGSGALYRYSLPLAGTGFFSLAMFQADRVLLGYLAGPEAVGLYNVAARLALLVIAPYWAAGQVFAPLVSEYWSSGRFERLRAAYQTVTAHFLVLLACSYALLVLHAERILRVFGEEFAGRETRLALEIVGAGMVCAALPGHNGIVHRMSGRSGLAAATTAAAALCNVGLNLLLIPRLGMLGAAAATAISLAAVNLAGLLLFPLAYRMRVHPFGPRYFAALGCALLAVAVAHGPGRGHPLWASALVVALLGAWASTQLGPGPAGWWQRGRPA